MISHASKSKLLRLKADLFDLGHDQSEGGIVDCLLSAANPKVIAKEFATREKPESVA